MRNHCTPFTNDGSGFEPTDLGSWCTFMSRRLDSHGCYSRCSCTAVYIVHMCCNTPIELGCFMTSQRPSCDCVYVAYPRTRHIDRAQLYYDKHLTVSTKVPGEIMKSHTNTQLSLDLKPSSRVQGVDVGHSSRGLLHWGSVFLKHTQITRERFCKNQIPNLIST